MEVRYTRYIFMEAGEGGAKIVSAAQTLIINIFSKKIIKKLPRLRIKLGTIAAPSPP